MVKRLTICILFSIILWFSGLVLYYSAIRYFANFPNSCNSEAIVVLTGGHARIKDAIDMLNPDSQQFLLISGTGVGVTKKDILFNFQQLKLIDEGRIFLGSYAQNTVDNAYETRAFMLIHGLTSLCLVTSDYHMPRSMMLFKRTLPYNYKIVYHALPTTNQLTVFQHAILLLQEYSKFIFNYISINEA